jgi:hypothetical protein
MSLPELSGTVYAITQATAAFIRGAVRLYRWCRRLRRRNLPMPAQVANDLIDAKELGRRLMMRPKPVLALARRGEIPCIRVSRKVIRFDYRAVLDALRRRQEERQDG